MQNDLISLKIMGMGRIQFLLFQNDALEDFLPEKSMKRKFSGGLKI